MNIVLCGFIDDNNIGSGDGVKSNRQTDHLFVECIRVNYRR